MFILSVVVLTFLYSTAMAGTEVGGPQVKELRFDPDRPETGDDLKLRIVLDGNAVRAEAKFLKNQQDAGSTYYDGISEFVKMDQPVKAGDKIEVFVTPFSAEGTPGNTVTKKVEIFNAAPTAKIVDQKLAGNTYSARIVAEDPEGEAVTFTLKEGPKGLTIDDKGHVNWKFGENVSGNFIVAVSIKDAKGAEAVLSYSIGLRWQSGR